jgi:hypothetical protein
MPIVPSGWRIAGRHQAAVVLTLAATYVVVMSAFSIWAYQGLRTQMDDLGNMAQAFWGACHGDWLMTQSNDVDGVLRSRLGVHTNLIFWALAPFYRMWPDPRLLLVVTSLACGAAGVGLHAFARHRLGSSALALIPPLAFWVSPLVQDANLYDFHVVTIVAALLVWMVWAFEAQRPRVGWLLFGLALLCQEHVAMLTAAYGAYLALTGRRREAAVMVAVSAAYALVVLGLLVPAINGGVTISKISGPDNRYRWVLRNVGEIPDRSLQPERLRMLAYFMICGGAACLKQWRFLLLLVPGLAGALLAAGPWMSRVTGTYYWVTEAAVIVMACTMAASRPGRPSPGPLVYLVGASAALSLLLSPLPYSLVSTWTNHARTPLVSKLAEVTRDVPADAPLMVQNNLGPPLAQRPFISRVPRRMAEAQYAIFYLRDVGGPDTGLFVRPDFRFLAGLSSQDLARLVRGFLAAPDWQLLRQQEGFYLFRRGAGRPPSPQVWATYQDDLTRLDGEEMAAKKSHLSWSRYLAGPWRWGPGPAPRWTSPTGS